VIRQSGTRGANPLALIATIQWHPFNYIMFFIKAVPAIAFGIAIGLLGTTAMQKHMNTSARITCNRPGIKDNHRLVSLSSVVGDTNYCMHIRYLAN
jgi:hypothetical protein